MHADDPSPGEHTSSEDAHRETSPAGNGSPEDPEQYARETVYRLLAVRARSRGELAQALRRKGVEPEIVATVLHKFADAGLIDDASFAAEWVRARHENQGLGRKALGVELRRKGIDEETVSEALATVDAEEEIDRARLLVRRKLRTMTAADPVARTRRLVGMLARKGYPESAAFRVVREEMEASDADGEVDD